MNIMTTQITARDVSNQIFMAASCNLLRSVVLLITPFIALMMLVILAVA